MALTRDPPLFRITMCDNSKSGLTEYSMVPESGQGKGYKERIVVSTWGSTVRSSDKKSEWQGE